MEVYNVQEETNTLPKHIYKFIPLWTELFIAQEVQEVFCIMAEMFQRLLNHDHDLRLRQL